MLWVQAGFVESSFEGKRLDNPPRFVLADSFRPALFDFPSSFLGNSFELMSLLCIPETYASYFQVPYCALAGSSVTAGYWSSCCR